MRSTLPSTLALLIIGITSLNAQDLYQFQNRWKPNEYIIADRLKLSTSTIRPDWWSAQWLFESVEGYYRINSRGGNHFVNIEYGPVECSSIEPGWWSAQWALEPLDGTSFYRIRNRWKPEIALHNERGYLEAGPVDLGWWSAQWMLIKVNGDGSVVAPAAGSTSNRRGDNPSAFTPEHNGRIDQASVRYTDQISIPGQVSVGSRIYFFPQEVVAYTESISFDPKNPSICGQTFTIIETTPFLKLDRPMPMMYNAVNDYFGFVIEVHTLGRVNERVFSSYG